MTSSLAYAINSLLSLTIVVSLGAVMLAIYRFLQDPGGPELVSDRSPGPPVIKPGPPDPGPQRPVPHGGRSRRRQVCRGPASITTACLPALGLTVTGSPMGGGRPSLRADQRSCATFPTLCSRSVLSRVEALTDALTTFDADRIVLCTHADADKHYHEDIDYREDIDILEVEERFGLAVDHAVIPVSST